MCVPFLGDHIVCIVVVSWVLCLLRQVAGCAMDELDLVGLVSLILGLMVGMVVLVVPLCLYSHVLFFHPHLHWAMQCLSHPLVHCHLLVGSWIVHLHFLFL